MFSFLKRPWWIVGWMLIVGMSWDGYSIAFAENGVTFSSVIAIIIFLAIQYVSWPIWLGIFITRIL
jgi:hypothetical protein